MILGMTPFTFVHVALSLVGIASGLVVLYGLLVNKPLDGWTAVFLVTTVLTSVTGFGFAVDKFMASHAVGILSLVALAVAIYARYFRRMVGPWRRVYVISALIALYFNCFVLVVQAFQKVPALHDLAPTQAESPFAIAQGVLLIASIALGVMAVKRFNGAPIAPT